MKVISGSLRNVLKPYKNHCFCTSGVDRWMHFLSNPHASMREIMAGTLKTLGKTTHTLCFHVRPTEPHESWREWFQARLQTAKTVGKSNVFRFLLPVRNNKMTCPGHIFAGNPSGKQTSAVWFRKNKKSASNLSGSTHLIASHVIWAHKS